LVFIAQKTDSWFSMLTRGTGVFLFIGIFKPIDKIRNMINNESCFAWLMILLFPFGLSASNVDSLRSLVANTEDVSERLTYLLELSDNLRYEDIEQSNFFLERARTLAQNQECTKGLGRVYFYEGRNHEAEENYIDAIAAYQMSLKYLVDDEYKADRAYVYYRLCSLNKTIGEFSSALENGQNGLKIYEKMRDLTGLRRVYNVLGSVYRYQGDYQQAINYYARSYEISKQQGYDRGVGTALNNWGLVHRLKGDLELALDFYHRSYQVKKRIGNKKSIANYYNNAGIIYLELDSLDKAYSFFCKTLDLRKEIEDRKGLVSIYHNFGDYAIKRENYPEAIKYLNRGLAIAEELNVPDKEKYLFESLTKAYEQAGMPGRALFSYKEFKRLSDSLYSSNKALKFARQEMNFQKQMQEQQSRIESQKMMISWGVAVAGLIVVLLVLLALYQRQKAKLAHHQLEAQKLIAQQEEIKQEVQVKNKELAAFSINLAQQNQRTEDVISRLRKLLPKLKRENNHEIQTLIREAEQAAPNKGWEEFELRFLQVHDGFYERLMEIFPTLTPNEKRLCAFLKLDMTTKEISHITGQTPHSVNVARTRLRKKIGLSNTETSLYDFVASI